MDLHYLDDLARCPDSDSTGQRGYGSIGTTESVCCRVRPPAVSPRLPAAHRFSRTRRERLAHAAVTMRLLVDSEFKPAGGIVGAGFDELHWPNPVRPGDELHVESEVLAVRPSKTRPEQGLVKVRTTTRNQHDEVVQVSVGNLVVQRRSRTNPDSINGAKRELHTIRNNRFTGRAVGARYGQLRYGLGPWRRPRGKRRDLQRLRRGWRQLH